MVSFKSLLEYVELKQKNTKNIKICIKATYLVFCLSLIPQVTY